MWVATESSHLEFLSMLSELWICMTPLSVIQKKPKQNRGRLSLTLALTHTHSQFPCPSKWPRDSHSSLTVIWYERWCVTGSSSPPLVPLLFTGLETSSFIHTIPDPSAPYFAPFSYSNCTPPIRKTATSKETSTRLWNTLEFGGFDSLQDSDKKLQWAHGTPRLREGGPFEVWSGLCWGVLKWFIYGILLKIQVPQGVLWNHAIHETFGFLKNLSVVGSLKNYCKLKKSFWKFVRTVYCAFFTPGKAKLRNKEKQFPGELLKECYF